ncbi:polyketide cyclase / dehydrase and lipid transport [Mycobacterium sp. E740]|nr:polyketide cyclase / dehydrase and lipid transport [Mycobacterium sp. E740]
MSLTARAQRVLTEEVGAPPAEVRAFYVDLDNIATVHPLVVSVRTSGVTRDEHGYRQGYRVTDRIPVGPVTLRVTYRAWLTVPVDGDVTAHARQFPGVRVDTVVGFAATDHGTRVTEHLTIEAPRPLASFTVRQAVDAHREMLAGIRRRFDG